MYSLNTKPPPCLVSSVYNHLHMGELTYTMTKKERLSILKTGIPKSKQTVLSVLKTRLSELGVEDDMLDIIAQKLIIGDIKYSDDTEKRIANIISSI